MYSFNVFYTKPRTHAPTVCKNDSSSWPSQLCLNHKYFIHKVHSSQQNITVVIIIVIIKTRTRCYTAGASVLWTQICWGALNKLGSFCACVCLHVRVWARLPRSVAYRMSILSKCEDPPGVPTDSSVYCKQHSVDSQSGVEQKCKVSPEVRARKAKLIQRMRPLWERQCAVWSSGAHVCFRI